MVSFGSSSRFACLERPEGGAKSSSHRAAAPTRSLTVAAAPGRRLVQWAPAGRPRRKRGTHEAAPRTPPPTLVAGDDRGPAVRAHDRPARRRLRDDVVVARAA